MQYHLDTIPVWEAMEWRRECPLCALTRKTEQEEAERALGASVMEPSERIKTNRLGICKAHHRMLFEQQNRLGHALLMDSHGKEQLEMLHKLQKQATAAAGGTHRLFHCAKTIASLALSLRKMAAHCVVCDAIEIHMARYRYTFLHLWKTDAEFQRAWAASKGVCLPHAADLLDDAQKHLTQREQNRFADEALAHLTASLQLDASDLDWFTRKFDYRNQDKPWGESKTALERMVNRLRGWCLGDEPSPKKK